MARETKRSGFCKTLGTEKTDTEVGEDGMDAGERVMRSEFLLGDPREADEVWKEMRERSWRQGEDILTGEGGRLLGGRVGHRWWWWFEDGVEANKGRGMIDSYPFR